MGKQRRGFTVIEVTLFLAISVLLLVGLVGGLMRNVAVERYNTAARGVVDFLKDVYATALNPENSRTGSEGTRTYCTISSAVKGVEGFGQTIHNTKTTSYTDYPGRTNCSIYGKIIVFGSSDGLIYVFDLIGKTVEFTMVEDPASSAVSFEDIKNLSDIEQLQTIGLGYAAIGDAGGTCNVTVAGGYSTYEPDWQAKVQDENGDNLVGMAMILRSPATGNVTTYIYKSDNPNKAPNVAGLIDSTISTTCSPSITKDAYNSLVQNNNIWGVNGGTVDYDNRLSGFSNDETNEIGVCIASDELFAAGARKYVSILGNGQNSSAVKVADDEEARTRCK